MRTFSLKPLPLTVAVFGVLAMQSAAANDAQTPTVELEHMTIQVERQGAKIKTNVVTTQEKDESTETELRGLLQDEPAIDFSGGNGMSQFITIRGMGQNSIDVKVDNAHSDSQILYHQGRFMLDPSLVKIVSVQKGAGSASSGIGGTNGAIIAKTVDANDLLKDSDKDWGIKVNAGYSSNDEHSYGVSGFGKTDKFDFLISGNRVEQDNYKAGDGYVSEVTGNNTVPFSALDKTSYLAKAGVNLGDHRFVLSHLKEENKGVRSVREEFDVIPSFSRLTMARQNPQFRKYAHENTNLEWIGKNMGFINEATANVYFMETSRKTDVPGSYERVAGTTSIKTTGANINFDSYPHDQVLLKYGVNYRLQEIVPNQERTGFVHQEKTDTGVYVEAIGDIGPVTATAGVRYDHFNFKAMNGKEVSDSDLNPSLGLIWQATPDLSFSATHNYATRSPRLVDALLSGVRNVTIADGAKAEKAQNSEIGFNYNRNLSNNSTVAVDGSYFWQSIDRLLSNGQVHDSSGNVISAGIDNIGRAKNQGWELNTRYTYNGLTARLGIAESDPQFYTDSDKFNASGTLISFANREYASRLGRTWTAGLAYRFNKPNVEVGINHRHVQSTTGTSAWMNDTVENLTAHRAGYNVTDLYANWKPYGNDKMNVNFAINNIGDEYYRTHVNSAAVSLPAVGREFRVGLNFTY